MLLFLLLIVGVFMGAGLTFLLGKDGLIGFLIGIIWGAIIVFTALQ